MENNYTIYAHVNKINHKIYIGQTKQKLNRRFRANGAGYKNSTRFYNDIQKYGWDNFDHIVLIENLTLEEANEVECFLIKKYDTINSDKGYNEALGGNGFSAFTSELIAKKNKQNWESGVYDNIKKRVYCVELNKEFDSALEAQRQTGIDNSTIQKVCSHKLKYCGFSPDGKPLHWLYQSEVNEEKIKELYFKKEILKGISVPVYCYELNEVFESAQDASNKYKIDASSIRKAARGVINSAGKHPITNESLHWIQKPELIKTSNKISQEKWDELNKGDA